ncbi:hypothetical protein CKA32_004993 [Geitlerinema sp. FC II]|nr:hypothetical protein CKA32_004993 [Geitlerinema sp. FC II]
MHLGFFGGGIAWRSCGSLMVGLLSFAFAAPNLQITANYKLSLYSKRLG